MGREKETALPHQSQVLFHSQLQVVSMKQSSSGRNPTPMWLTVVGVLVTSFLLWSFWSLAESDHFDLEYHRRLSTSLPVRRCLSPNRTHDPLDKTYLDDPDLNYLIGHHRMHNWDYKRRDWLAKHPSFAPGSSDRIMMVTGSQPNSCKNPIGDHLLLRLFKNKVDYCRIHNYDLFYNNVMLHPKMFSYWAKLPAVRAAMLAHPEVEWIWWVDSDAIFTDMEFKPPMEKYKNHNLVVHGWAEMIYEEKSWTGLNAGVFLIRNSQWSMEFMDVWASLGPMSPDYNKWGHVLKSMFKDKKFADSDDQSALVYLIYTYRERWADKIYLERDYDFESYWPGIVDLFSNLSDKYAGLESRVEMLRRRHAEKVSERYGAEREEYLRREAGSGGIGQGSWRRPPITHFTGCQPCNGEHNPKYESDACWNGMVKALNYADNQVLRNYGFVHPDLQDSDSVLPVPFDYVDSSANRATLNTNT